MISSLRPVRELWPTATPQNGPGSRGKSTNKSSASGNAGQVSAAVRLSPVTGAPPAAPPWTRWSAAVATEGARQQQRQACDALVAQQRRVEQEVGDEHQHR
jgi:hypothetical protein